MSSLNSNKEDRYLIVNSLRMLRRLMLCSAASAGVLFGAEAPELPAWFWSPPRLEGVQLAVGYATAYRDSSTSYAEAFQDAAQRLWLDRQCHISVNMACASYGDQITYMGSTFRVESDTSGYAHFVKMIEHLDSCWTDDVVLALVGTQPVRLDKMLVPPPVDIVFEMPGYLYGQGISQDYYYASNSWRAAENDARRSLAITANTRLTAMLESANELMLHTSNMETSVELKSIQTVYRTWHEEMNIYKITVYAPIFESKKQLLMTR